MCGIIGRFFKGESYRPLAQSDLARLSHRGPDDSGLYTAPHIQLGHTRLSIIDLTDAAKQPMSSLDGRYVGIYNGEIYNHIEIRLELESLGERFHSHSDTEVLLTAYKVWGEKCVGRFRGMFAFAIWDNTDHTLFLARDRCGEKPLFYYRDGSCFTFASELKALLPLLPERQQLDPAVVDMYLHYQYVPEPFTLLKNIHKLPAAHTLHLTLKNWQAEPKRYWNVEKIAENPQHTNTPDILDRIRESLEGAITLTLRSDVPVGVALSGGIDSGAIATIAQKHYPEPMHAFCVGYPGRPPYDERHQARALAESIGMIVHEVELPVENFVAFFPNLVRIMDEPIADPAAFGHYSVPKAAADQGIKVLLSGIGGDEVFWGYNWVTQTVSTNQALSRNPSLSTIANWASSNSAQRFLNKVVHFSHTPALIRGYAEFLRDIGNIDSSNSQLHFYSAEPYFRDAFRLKPQVYGKAMQTLAEQNPFTPTKDVGARSFDQIPAAVIRMLFDTWLVSNCLTLGDRVSMSVGVESRLPFLDSQLIELVMMLRSNTPDHQLGQKAWLRAALKGVLPAEVLARPKAGFQPPVGQWLSGVITAYGSILRDGALVRQGIIDAQKVDYVLEKMPTQGWPDLFFTYKLVLLEMWIQKIVNV